MKVGIAQIRPYLGRIDQNWDKHAQMITKAKQEEVDLLIFPELSLTGYNLLDLTFEVARKSDHEEIQSLVQLADGVDLVFGFVEQSVDHTLYNSAIYASNQQIVHTHRKVYLPTYGMFDEARYFGRGQRIRNFPTKWGRMGLLICEDAWHPTTSYLLAQDGAECLIMLANSPAKGVTHNPFHNQQTWRLLTQTQATIYSTYCLFANRVGSEDGVTFYGHSHIIGPDGRVINEAALFEEELLIQVIDLDEVRRARYRLPLLRDENIELTIRELQRIQTRRIEGVDGR